MSVDLTSQSSSNSSDAMSSLTLVSLLDGRPASRVMKKPRNATSWVWNYMTLKDDDGKVVVCIECNAELVYNNSTSKLTKHMERAHKSTWLKNLHRGSNESGGIDKFVVRTSNNTVFGSLIRLFVEAHLPASLVENEYFRAFLKVHNPLHTQVYSREKVTRELAIQADYVRMVLKKILRDQHVALTTDHWTSLANHSYMAMTAHWINDDWELISTTLCCDHHESVELNGQEIVNLINDAYAKYHIRPECISAVVTDTAAVMNAAGMNLNCAHHYCAAHVIELTTRMAFNMIESTDNGEVFTMKAARKLVGHFKHSPKQTEILREVQSTHNIPEVVNVIEDVATRWWSTFTMCERLLRLKVSIDFMEANRGLECNLTPSQWKNISVLCEVLRPFMAAQKCLEGQKYVTISLIPGFIHSIRNSLDTVRTACESETVRNLCGEMYDDFCERWGSGLEGTLVHENEVRGVRNRQKGLPLSVLLASAVDPRTKFLPGIPDRDKVELRNVLRAELLKLGNGDVEVVSEPIAPAAIAPNIPPSVIDDCFSVFHPPQQPAVVSNTRSWEELIDDELAQFHVVPGLGLKDPKGGFWNPLTWWEQNEDVYPNIAKLARRLLCIPATSAPSERVFSNAGLTIDSKRAAMLPDNASDLVFLHDSWKVADMYICDC